MLAFLRTARGFGPGVGASWDVLSGRSGVRSADASPHSMLRRGASALSRFRPPRRKDRDHRAARRGPGDRPRRPCLQGLRSVRPERSLPAVGVPDLSLLARLDRLASQPHSTARRLAGARLSTSLRGQHRRQGEGSGLSLGGVRCSSLRLAARVAIALCLTGTSPSLATEPCLRSPCDDSSGSLGRSKCVEAATWVAVGAVSNVVHHPAGAPLSEDFAAFTFTVRRWEKGKGQANQKYRFKVGWGENQHELPKDTTLPFRASGKSP